MSNSKLSKDEFKKITGIDLKRNTAFKSEIKWGLVELIRLYYGKSGHDDAVDIAMYALTFLTDSKNGIARLLASGIIRFDNDNLNKLFQDLIARAPRYVTMEYYDEYRIKANRSSVASE